MNEKIDIIDFGEYPAQYNKQRFVMFCIIPEYTTEELPERIIIWELCDEMNPEPDYNMNTNDWKEFVKEHFSKSIQVTNENDLISEFRQHRNRLERAEYYEVR